MSDDGSGGGGDDGGGGGDEGSGGSDSSSSSGDSNSGSDNGSSSDNGSGSDNGSSSDDSSGSNNGSDSDGSSSSGDDASSDHSSGTDSSTGSDDSDGGDDSADSSSDTTTGSPDTTSQTDDTSQATSAGFDVSIPGMQSSISALSSTADGMTDTTSRFQGFSFTGPAFGGIGASVSDAHDQLTDSLGTALSSANQGFTGFNSSLGTTLNGYVDADNSVMGTFNMLGGPDAVAQLAQNTTPAAQTPDPAATDPAADPAAAATSAAQSLPALTTLGAHHYGDSGTDISTMQQQLNDLGYNVGTVDGHWGLNTTAALAQYANDQGVALGTAPGQVSDTVVQAIMHAEAPNDQVHSPNGTPEIYGFRQDMNNGYAQILGARNQYGSGSAGEQAAITQAISNEAQSVGADQFTDPGVQATLISSAHMRGPGGTMAMLNAMAGGQQDSAYANGHLDPGTVGTLNQLSPDQFQDQFQAARENYDLNYYIDGGRIQNHGTIPDNQWQGVQNRYQQDHDQFGNLSPQHQSR